MIWAHVMWAMRGVTVTRPECRSCGRVMPRGMYWLYIILLSLREVQSVIITVRSTGPSPTSSPRGSLPGRGWGTLSDAVSHPALAPGSSVEKGYSGCDHDDQLARMPATSVIRTNYCTQTTVHIGVLSVYKPCHSVCCVCCLCLFCCSKSE